MLWICGLREEIRGKEDLPSVNDYDDVKEVAIESRG
jgi:hypothetical protein